MKSIVVMVMLALLSACSSTPTKTSQTAGGGTKIRVTATGSTFEEAKSIAFNRAIEHVVGSVIVNEKESRNDKLIRNDNLNHSSGYIDDYLVIKSTSNGKSVTVEMDVVVKDSKIANRILNKDTDSSNINGQQLATQYSSYLDSRRSATQITSNVLSDFPEKTFSPKLVSSEYMLDGLNNSRFIVGYKVDWNYNWLVAFDEAAKLAADSRSYFRRQEKITIIKRKPGDWVGSNQTYYYDDAVYYDMVVEKLRPTVVFYAKIKNVYGRTIACQQVNFFGIYTAGSVVLEGAQPFYIMFDFKFPPNAINQVEALNNIEVGSTLDMNYCK